MISRASIEYELNNSFNYLVIMLFLFCLDQNNFIRRHKLWPITPRFKLKLLAALKHQNALLYYNIKRTL